MMITTLKNSSVLQHKNKLLFYAEKKKIFTDEFENYKGDYQQIKELILKEFLKSKV